MLVKEKQINKHNKLMVEKVEIEKLSVVNVLERLDLLILIKLFYIEPKDQILRGYVILVL